MGGSENSRDSSCPCHVVKEHLNPDIVHDRPPTSVITLTPKSASALSPKRIVRQRLLAQPHSIEAQAADHGTARQHRNHGFRIRTRRWYVQKRSPQARSTIWARRRHEDCDNGTTNTGPGTNATPRPTSTATIPERERALTNRTNTCEAQRSNQTIRRNSNTRQATPPPARHPNPTSNKAIHTSHLLRALTCLPSRFTTPPTNSLTNTSSQAPLAASPSGKKSSHAT
jgi:hypothetical protein